MRDSRKHGDKKRKLLSQITATTHCTKIVTHARNARLNSFIRRLVARRAIYSCREEENFSHSGSHPGVLLLVAEASNEMVAGKHRGFFSFRFDRFETNPIVS